MSDYLSVTIEDYEDLSDAEKAGASDNGSGKDMATYIRVSHKGETIFLESDAMEREDANFYRDLSWISSVIVVAYNLGRADGVAAERKERA